MCPLTLKLASQEEEMDFNLPSWLTFCTVQLYGYRSPCKQPRTWNKNQALSEMLHSWLMYRTDPRTSLKSWLKKKSQEVCLWDPVCCSCHSYGSSPPYYKVVPQISGLFLSFFKRISLTTPYLSKNRTQACYLAVNKTNLLVAQAQITIFKF